MTAVVSEADWPFRTDAPPAAHELWRHERLVAELMARHSVLPARAGSVYRDGAAILAGVGEVLVGDLRPAPPQPAGGRTGAENMTAQLEVYRRANAIERMFAPLAEHARDDRIEPLPRPGVPLRAAYLVALCELERFIERVAAIDSSLQRRGGELRASDPRTHAEPEVVVDRTGPWPPYSFAGAVPEAGTGAAS